MARLEKICKKEHLGRYDLKEVSMAADWHIKRFPDEPGRTYMFYDGDRTCVFTFYGDEKTLLAINWFLGFYRKMFWWR